MFFSEKNLCMDCFIAAMDDEELRDYNMGRLHIFEGDDGYCDRCGGYEAIVEDFSYSYGDDDEESEYNTDFEEEDEYELEEDYEEDEYELEEEDEYYGEEDCDSELEEYEEDDYDSKLEED